MKWLFLHGASGSKDKWRELKPYFSGFQADFIDLPGHGHDKGSLPESIEAYAEILEGRIDDETIVVGHSMGGLIGIALATRTNKVKALVLVASHYQLPVHPDFLRQLEEGEYPEKFFRAAYGKQVDPMLLAEEKRIHEESALKTAYADFSCCNEYNGKEALAGLTIPLLAVYGAEDRMIPKDAAAKLKSVYPHAMTEAIEHAGHYVILEKPRELADRLKRFINKREEE